MTVTPERKEAVEPTNPNLKVAVQALVLNDSVVKSLDDLATRTTIVTTGTTADIWLTKNHPDWKLLKFREKHRVATSLSAGRGDAYAQDNLRCSAGQTEPGYRVLEQKLGDEAIDCAGSEEGQYRTARLGECRIGEVGRRDALAQVV